MTLHQLRTIDWKIWLLLALLSVPVSRWAWSWWTLPPVISIRHFTQLQLMRTAVSSRDLPLVEKIMDHLGALHIDGTVSDAEWVAISGIADQARAGEWTAADRAAFRLEEAQQSRWRTAEDTADHASHDHHADHGSETGRQILANAEASTGDQSAVTNLANGQLSNNASRTKHATGKDSSAPRLGKQQKLPPRLPHPGSAVQPAR